MTGINIAAPFIGVGETVGVIFLSANIHHAIIGTVTGPVVYTAAQAFLLSKLIKDSLMIELIKAAYEYDLKKYTKPRE